MCEALHSSNELFCCEHISPQVSELKWLPQRLAAFQYIKTLQPSISTSLVMLKSWRWELRIS